MTLMNAVTFEDKAWIVFGMAAQGVFTARFVTQWIASERKKESVIPVAFWWLSIMGGFMLFCYALRQRDPVFILGQGLGLTVYVRNLMLVAKGKKRAEKQSLRTAIAKGTHQRVDAAETVRAG